MSCPISAPWVVRLDFARDASEVCVVPSASLLGSPVLSRTIVSFAKPQASEMTAVTGVMSNELRRRFPQAVPRNSADIGIHDSFEVSRTVRAWGLPLCIDGSRAWATSDDETRILMLVPSDSASPFDGGTIKYSITRENSHIDQWATKLPPSDYVQAIDLMSFDDDSAGIVVTSTDIVQLRISDGAVVNRHTFAQYGNNRYFADEVAINREDKLVATVTSNGWLRVFRMTPHPVLIFERPGGQGYLKTDHGAWLCRRMAFSGSNSIVVEYNFGERTRVFRGEVKYYTEILDAGTGAVLWEGSPVFPSTVGVSMDQKLFAIVYQDKIEIRELEGVKSEMDKALRQ